MDDNDWRSRGISDKLQRRIAYSIMDGTDYKSNVLESMIADMSIVPAKSMEELKAMNERYEECMTVIDAHAEANKLLNAMWMAKADNLIVLKAELARRRSEHKLYGEENVVALAKDGEDVKLNCLKRARLDVEEELEARACDPEYPIAGDHNFVLMCLAKVEFFVRGKDGALFECVRPRALEDKDVRAWPTVNHFGNRVKWRRCQWPVYRVDYLKHELLDMLSGAYHYSLKKVMEKIKSQKWDSYGEGYVEDWAHDECSEFRAYQVYSFEEGKAKEVCWTSYERFMACNPLPVKKDLDLRVEWGRVVDGVFRASLLVTLEGGYCSACNMVSSPWNDLTNFDDEWKAKFGRYIDLL